LNFRPTSTGSNTENSPMSQQQPDVNLSLQGSTIAAESVFDSFQELHDLMKQQAREYNFRLKVERHEKSQGSGLWRGRFFCGGDNQKRKHGEPPLVPCTFCVPFTYLSTGEHRIKGETGNGKPMCLDHNHAMHGLLTVPDMLEDAITHKRSRQQLTEAEIGIIRQEAGSHTAIMKITVTELVEQTELQTELD